MRHSSIVLASALAALLVSAAPAGAVFGGAPTTPLPPLRAETNTQLVLSGLGPGTGVSGFIANPDNPFDPVADGYPTSDPTTGFTPKDESFAGLIHARPPGGGAETSLYCIDIDTNTFIGFGYVLGTWDEANVPNVGFVGRLLNEFYPTTDEPASLTNLDQRAAAVQAAIWFFSDRYVLRTASPLHDATVAIVDRIIAEGPLRDPDPPSLTITPPQISGAAGRVLGPFTVTTDAPPAAVSAIGGDMFSDASATEPIPDGAAVPSGKRIWLRSAGGSTTAVLQATSVATVPKGNVYLYDGNAGVSAAQKLILAQTATLSTTVRATAQFLAPGSLTVTKTIAGPAAGSQGAVVVHVACDDGVDRPDFEIPARASAGARSRTYTAIPVGTTCAVTETADGSTVGTEVIVTGDGQQVTIRSGRDETVNMTDTYRFVGSLLVRKTISGPGAGRQGEVTIHTTCDGTALTPDFVIPAGAPAGDRTRQYDRIDAPATCTVTETADGSTSEVSVVVDGSGRQVPIAAGAVAEADIADSYGLVPGQLEVTKTITGSAAGAQGPAVVRTVCNGIALTPDLVIPSGAPAGVRSQTYSGVPTPANCVTTEIADGATAAVSVVVTGSPNATTISPGGAGTAHITDTYARTARLAVSGTQARAADGSLLVSKTIAGPAAGRQGRVTIRVTCDGTVAGPDLVIAAGRRAGRVSRSFDGIAPGSRCVVTEPSNGAHAGVGVIAAGTRRVVIVPGGRVRPVNVIDVYQPTSGSLRVTKTIAGPAARRHGRIAILVACGGPLRAFAFLVRPRTLVGSVSRQFADLPAGARCVVREVVKGGTRAVAVRASRRGAAVVRIRPLRSATVHLTDRFAVATSPRFTG